MPRRTPLNLTMERLEERAVPATLQVIHNSPFESAAVVDVLINGTTAIDDFAFQTATPFLDVTTLDNDSTTDGIQLDISVTTADGMTEVFATPVSLDTGEEYIAAAVGEPFNDFGLSLFTPARTSAGVSNTDLLVLHGSPDAPTVDIVARDVATLVDDLSFTEFSDDYVSVLTDNYVIDVTTQDGATGLFSFDVPLAELGLDGAALTVAASGFADPSPDQPGFSLLAVLPNGDTLVIEPQVTQLQVIHNSPFASASVVDVLVNGATVLDDFAFQDASPFLDVTALDKDSNLLNGVQLDISVTTADGATEVFATSVDLGTGVDYVAAAVGEPFNGFGLSVFAPAQTTGTMAGNTDLLVLHGSPDAPTVDIVARGVATLVDDLSFTEFSDGYVSVPTDAYTIDVTLADGKTRVFTFDVDLAALNLDGQALTVAASGFLFPESNQPSFVLQAVLANGDTVVIEPETSEIIDGTDRRDRFSVRLDRWDSNIAKISTPEGRVQYFVPTAPEITLNGLDGSDTLNLYLPKPGENLPFINFDGGADHDHINIYGSRRNDSISVSEESSKFVLTLNGNTLAATDIEGLSAFGNRGHDEIDLSGIQSFGVHVNGGSGNDTIIGGAGNDVLFGSWGNDEIRGGDGHDSLFGGFGKDKLFGEEGNDVLFGGFGKDTLDGGPGDDFPH